MCDDPVGDDHAFVPPAQFEDAGARQRSINVSGAQVGTGRPVVAGHAGPSNKMIKKMALRALLLDIFP